MIYNPLKMWKKHLKQVIIGKKAGITDHFVEKKAENLYRTISQKMINLPSSNGAVTSTVGKAHHIDLTPKESELLSKHVADDSYMKKQKEDIPSMLQ